MLFFNFQIDTITGVLQYHDILKCRNRYPDLLQICGDFQIIVDKQIFFSQPQFPILEFCGAVRKWEKSHLRMRNMYYSSVETDNNPLICFIRTNRMWKIQSPWELFNSKILFSRAEISASLNALYKNVNMQLSDFA